MITSSAPFTLNRRDLQEIAQAHAAGYSNARPFPNAVLDDFVPRDVVEEAAGEFPTTEAEGWQIHLDSGTRRKLTTEDETAMGPVCRQLVSQFQSGPMVEFLETLTGIEGIIPDPHLGGGGLHQIERGGYLRVHADFNHYRKLDLDRRINVLLFLNPDWRDEWGGQLELWSPDMTQAERRVAPLGGRIAIFSTTSTSYHGHPDPLACPDGVVRRSMAFYYYTNGRPLEERRLPHATAFQVPGGPPVQPKTTLSRAARLRRFGYRWTPPAAVEWAKRGALEVRHLRHRPQL